MPRRSIAVAFAPLVVAVAVIACATNPQPKNKVASRRPSADSIGCLDTLRAADSVTTIVKMTVSSLDSAVPLPPDFENFFVEEFRRHFNVPPKLPLTLVMGSEPCDSLGSRCAGGLLAAGASAYATAHNNGKLSDIAVLDVGLTPRFADSVSSALRAMSRAEMVPPMGDVESLSLVVQIFTEKEPDTVPADRHLFQAKVPRYDLPFTYATMPAAGVDARYPFTARLAGVEDSVILAFTVDSDGTIDAQSIELVSAHYQDFILSVLDALGRTRYHPAHLGDCAVATRMKQRFMFRFPE